MQTKGTTIIYIPEFIKKNFGDEAYTKWLNSLPPESSEIYKGMILPSNWYDMNNALIVPTQKICELFYGGDINKCAEEAGKFSADYALKGIYKFFVKLGSPQFIIKKASTILPTYYEPSKMELVELQDNSAILRITEFADMVNMIEIRIKGWMIRALEIAGCKNVIVEITKSLTTGDNYTEYHIKWI